MKSLSLIDDGEKYIWIDSTSKKRIPIEYGSFILMMIYLGNEFFLEKYEDVIGYREILLLANGVIEDEEDMEYEQHLGEFLEQEKDELDLYIEDSVTWGIPADVKYILDVNAMAVMKQVIQIDFYNIFYQTRNEKEVRRKIPAFLQDTKLKQKLTSVLRDDDIKQKSAKRRNLIERTVLMEYFQGIPLSSVIVYENDKILTKYNLTGLHQLMMLELVKVESCKTQFRFKICPICKKLYREKRKAGGHTGYCSYRYPNESCKERAKRERTPELMSLYETHKEAIRKYCSRKWDEHELKLSYREDYDNWHVKTISNKNITAGEYEKLYEEWWGNKIKEARQLLKEMKKEN